MSKVLKVVATVVGVALVAASLFVPGLNVAVATALMTVGASLAMSGLSSLLQGASKPKAAAGGPPEKWKADPFAGIPYVMGRSAVGGNIVYKAGHGTNNVYYTTVTALSLGLIASIEATTLDKQPISNFSGHVYQSTQLGACPESAALSAPVATPPGWDSTCKLSGIAASMLTFKYDTSSKSSFTSIPQPLWVLHGVKVYDPRLDSTYPGGSGSCRALNESTYVYSENPGLHALTWCLGRWQNGVRVAGIGAPIASLDVPSFIECANLCDARSWVLGGQVYTRPDTLWNSLTSILQAGGSQPVFYAGKISVINRAPRVSLATITSGDIIGDCTFAATQSRRDRINQVVPNYRSEAHDWQVVAGSAIAVPSYVAMDGDERTKEITYPLVQTVNQVAQLAAYDIMDSREAGPGKIQLKPHWLNYRPGDCVTFQPEDGATIKVEITGRELDANSGSVTFDVRGETDAKHSFALGQTGTAPPITTLTYSNAVAAPGVNDWTLSGTTITANGASAPALVLTGALSNPNADAIIFEYRVHNAANGTDDNWSSAGVETPTTTSKQITSVMASTSYDVSVRYRVRGILGDRRILGPVTSGTSAIGWSAVGSIPTSLTDGRVAAGLTANGVVNQRVPSNLVGIAPGNIYLDPNFTDQSLITVIGSNVNFVTATQTITPAGVATADTSSAADLVTMGATKATKSVGNGTSGRWRSPFYQLPGPGTYVAALRLLYKAGGNFNGSLGLTFYDKNGTQLPQATTTIAYTGLTSDLLQDVTVTGTAPAGAFYAALNPNFGGTATPFYMALPTIRAVTTPGIANLGDTSNMVPDADFLDPAITWNLPAIWTVSPNSNTGEGAGVNKITIPTAVTGSAKTAPIACTPGKTILHSFYAKKTAAGSPSDYCLVGCYFLNAAKALVQQQYFILNGSVADGRNQSLFKAPANTAFVQFFIYTAGGFSTTWELSEPILRFATVSGDNLIGSNGTTVLTDSAIVTSLGTAAYLYGSGAGAYANNLAQLDAAAAAKVTGIANGATNTTAYSQSTAPTSPNNGDVWNDTSTNPVTIKVRVAGVWVTGATYVSNTSQIADTAGLGNTATWAGVIGTGKPADNATNTTTYAQSTAPTSPNNGDVWNDTSTIPATVKLRVGGAWVVGSTNVTNTNQITDGANLGNTSTWTGVTGTGKPADNATVGAKAGINLLDSGGSLVLDNGFLNTRITVDPTTGQLINIGTSGVAVDNSKQLWAQVSGAGKPADGATRQDDGANLIVSPYKLDRVINLVNGAVVQTNGSGSTRPADNIRVVLPSNSSSYVSCAWGANTDIAVMPGDVLFYGHTVWMDPTVTDAMDAGYSCYGSNGAFIGSFDLPSTTMSGATDLKSQWVRKTGSFTVPANTSFVSPYVVRPPSSSPGLFYIAEPYLGRSQQGADITAANQVQITYTTSKTISADYTGVIASGVLPTTVPAPKVTLGGVDVTQANNVQYAIVNASGGCAGNVTVDTTNGSATKAVQVIGTGFNASGSYQLQITVNGYALPLISVTVTKKLADPPSGGGGGGGGSGATSGTMSSGGYAVFNTSYVQVGSTISNLTVASGKTASASGGDDYDCINGSTSIGNVRLQAKWQYSVAGANSWTDMGSATLGSVASYDKFGNQTPGSLSCNQSVAPSAGSYDFRLMVAIYAGSSGAAGQFEGSGAWSVNIA